jgi:hypothetical protein
MLSQIATYVRAVSHLIVILLNISDTKVGVY